MNVYSHIPNYRINSTRVSTTNSLLSEEYKLIQINCFNFTHTREACFLLELVRLYFMYLGYINKLFRRERYQTSVIIHKNIIFDYF